MQRSAGSPGGPRLPFNSKPSAATEKNKKENKRPVNQIAVMFPGEGTGLFDDTLATSYPNSNEGVKGHKQVVYLIGEITYWTFHKKHTSRFCGLWVPEGNGFNVGRGCNTWTHAD